MQMRQADVLQDCQSSKVNRNTEGARAEGLRKL